MVLEYLVGGAQQNVYGTLKKYIDDSWASVFQWLRVDP